MINFKNIKPVNTTPIDVDYNNMDEEGGVKLTTESSVESIKKLGINLKEGQLVLISDSELEYLGVVILRRDCLVVVPIEVTRKDL